MNDPKPYRAICFDLDGTLLPMDLDEFMTSYFSRIATFMQENGIESAWFMDGLKEGTKAMATHADDRTNEQAYWEAFWERCPSSPADREALLKAAHRFYFEDFAHIGDGFETPSAPARIVRALREKGYPLVLTTMPMFPKEAVEHRLRWAGIDPGMFERITHYENSKSVKPHLTYFAENLAAMGLDGEDVLMVGNNTMEDLSFLGLGTDAYLITDYLLNPIDMDLDSVRHGSMEEFEAWVATLPPCANPATNIEAGPIPHGATCKALEANAVHPNLA